MVHTLPDYTTKYKMTQVFGSVDVNENAARLGSIDTFQREGNVLWMDDFEGATTAWNAVAEDASGSVALNATYHRSGTQCMMIDPGSVVDKESVLENLVPVRNAGTLGFEIAFSGGALCKMLDFRMWLYNGVTTHKAEIRYDIVNSKLQYLDSAGAYQDIATSLNLLTSKRCFHIIKFVVDFTNNKYMRVYLNQNEYSLADIGLQSVTIGTYSHLFLGIRVESNHALNSEVYVDNFILTENEL